MAAPAVQVRVAMAADAAAINRIYNHYVRTTAITFDEEEWDLHRREKWLAGFDDDGQYFALVAEAGDGDGAGDGDAGGGRILGFAYNSRFRARAAYRFSCETTIYTAYDNAIPGVGTALYSALFQRIADTDLHRAYAVIALPNARSVAFHRKFGFERIGVLHQAGRKFGEWVDVAWLEKRLNARE